MCAGNSQKKWIWSHTGKTLDLVWRAKGQFSREDYWAGIWVSTVTWVLLLRDWKENRKSLLFWLSFGAEGVTCHPSISQQTLHELCILQWHYAKNRTPRSFCLPMSSQWSQWPYTAWPQRVGHLHGPHLWGATMLQASTIKNTSFSPLHAVWS